MSSTTAFGEAQMNGTTAMPANTKFWDRNAEKYSRSPIKNMDAYNKTMERTRAHLKPTDHVLEVGCGTASTALLLAPEVKRITASDFSPKMIEIGRAKAQKAKVSNIDFLQGTPSDNGLKDATYDAVLAFSFLHLVEDLPATLTRLHALLKPDGLLISKTVCLAEQTRLWGIPIALMRSVGMAPYVNLLTFKKLEGAIDDARFKIVETGSYPPKPPSRFVVARKI